MIIKLQNIQLFGEFNTGPLNVKARLFVISVRHRQIEMISDGNKIIEVKIIQLKILNFEDFMKKYKIKNDTMNESHLRRVYNHNIYPRVSRINSDKGFVNVYNGSQGGSHWTCFIIKDKKSFFLIFSEDLPINFY